MNEDKILQMFFDIGRWTKAIEKGVLKDIRKDQLIRLTDEHTRMAMAYAMRRGKYEISPPHTAQIPKDNGTSVTVPCVGRTPRNTWERKVVNPYRMKTGYGISAHRHTGCRCF